MQAILGAVSESRPGLRSTESSALRAATQINGRHRNTPYHGGTDGGILRDAHFKLAEVYGAASPGAVYELVLLPHIFVGMLHTTLAPL